MMKPRLFVAVGPALAGIVMSASAASAGGWATGAEDYAAESVRTPGAFISPAFEPIGGPTEAMPLLAVSDAELDALVRYLLGS
jgi:hypothetical protein